MRLISGAVAKVPRIGTSLGYGLRNFELAAHDRFRKAGTTNATLQTQTLHSDHRRWVENGRFNEDGFRLRQDHPIWHTLEQWNRSQENQLNVSPPADATLGPLSFLSSSLPGTSILLKSKRTGLIEEVEVPLGCFVCFSGHEIHGGNRYLKPHRRLHIYANVRDLRFLPISRAEHLWTLAAAAQDSFDEDYMQVLKMRALESLDVYEFE